MNNTFLPQAVELVKQAIDYDNLGDLEKALGLYQKALEYFLTGLKYEPNPTSKRIIQEKVAGYINRAEEIKKALEEASTKGGGKGGPGGAATLSKEDAKKESKEDDEKNKMRGALSSAIVGEKPNVKWDDVAGLDGAKEALKEAVILPIKFPQLFTGKRKPWKGILLYGPPGTGKSFLAKAVATETDGTFFAVSSSDLVSKWQGESEKLVRQMFEMAREATPAIVFIDEIDSLCTARSEGESESSRRIKTEFLVQMDGVGSSQHGGVLVLGATNVPWELDPAMRRRFEKRVYIALPERHARTNMFKLNLGDTPHTLSEADFEVLGERSEGYSGSDIAVVVREALMEPLRKCQLAKQFLRDANGFLHPCVDYPNCPACPMELLSALPGTPSVAPGSHAVCTSCGAERMSLYDVPGERLAVPRISAEDFAKALGKAHSSVGVDELGRFESWTSEFGQEG